MRYRLGGLPRVGTRRSTPSVPRVTADAGCRSPSPAGTPLRPVRRPVLRGPRRPSARAADFSRARGSGALSRDRPRVPGARCTAPSRRASRGFEELEAASIAADERCARSTLGRPVGARVGERYCARTTRATPETSIAAAVSVSTSMSVAAATPAERIASAGDRGAEREDDRQLVRSDRLRAMAVIAGAEFDAQSVVDDRAQLLQLVKDGPGCVAGHAAQRDARAVLRP